MFNRHAGGGLEEHGTGPRADGEGKGFNVRDGIQPNILFEQAIGFVEGFKRGARLRDRPA